MKVSGPYEVVWNPGPLSRGIRARERLLVKMNDHKFHSLGLLVSASIGSWACAGKVQSENESAGHANDWYECSLFEDEDDGRSSCADISVPARWEQPDNSETFNVHAKRWLRGGSTQLWMVAGGPGIGASTSLPAFVEAIAEHLPRVDFYLLDARGTGHSEYLRCEDGEAVDSVGGTELTPSEVDDCVRAIEAEYGDLSQFGISQSARDLKESIERQSSGYAHSIVWAQSAGTLTVQRMLLDPPAHLDGVILEGVVAPGFSLKYQDAAADRRLRELLTLCEIDSNCAARFPDAVEKTAALWGNLRLGSCGQVTHSVETLQFVLYRMLGESPMNSAIPAYLHHLFECDEPGLLIVDEIVGLLGGSVRGSREYSVAAFQLIAASELWDDPSYEHNEDYVSYLDDLYSTSLLGSGTRGHVLAAQMASWPTYSDPLVAKYPKVSIPMLVLHGDLDPL